MFAKNRCWIWETITITQFSSFKVICSLLLFWLSYFIFSLQFFILLILSIFSWIFKRKKKVIEIYHKSQHISIYFWVLDEGESWLSWLSPKIVSKTDGIQNRGELCPLYSPRKLKLLQLFLLTVLDFE